jgi:hypothetical protein
VVHRDAAYEAAPHYLCAGSGKLSGQD